MQTQNEDFISLEVLNQEIESSYFQRALANAIDLAIEIALIFCTYLLFQPMISTLLHANSSYKYIITLILVYAYRLTTILFFKRTIGMMACRLKYLNNKVQPITGQEILLAVSGFRTSSLKIYQNN
jgi:uncharacterized RDD family membrane protein YckC